LIAAFAKIVDWLYLEFLAPFYNPDGLDEATHQKVQEILSTKTMQKAKVDLNSFSTNYAIWRRLNVNPQPDIHFPLPKCARIIPYVNSYWNSTKGASDTITGLFDDNDEKLGVRTAQTIPVAHLLMLQQTLFFRGSQMLRAKDNLDECYYTLAH
jgi:hypothetical protein